jgi:hypothetical protein
MTPIGLVKLTAFHVLANILLLAALAMAQQGEWWAAFISLLYAAGAVGLGWIAYWLDRFNAWIDAKYFPEMR